MIFVLGLGLLMLIGYFVAQSFKISPTISKDIKHLNEKLALNLELDIEEKERMETYIKELC
jgi:hypothetical protein